MLIDLPGADGRVCRLATSGLVRPKAPGAGSRLYLVDTRDTTSPTFRGVALEAIDTWLDTVGGDVALATVASSGTTLGALWAGAGGHPFWNVLVKGRRARGLCRELEPDVDVAGRDFVLLDNHARSGQSLRCARSIVEDHGGKVVAAGVFTAGDDVVYDGPLHVFLPHGVISRIAG